MLLPLTEDRFEIDEFYGPDRYPKTTAIYADNMLIFNYLTRYWIMNGSTLIESSSTILTEYYKDYRDMVVQNGSVVVIEGEIPDGAHVLFLTEDKTRADIVSRLITNKYAEQRLGISGMHTHDVVGERRRKICWDDLPRTTWKSEQDEPVFTKGEMLSSGKTSLIVGRNAAVKRALEIRIKSFDGELIHFGADVEELGSLGEYMDFLTDDNLDNNSHVLIPNIYEIMREFYRSELIDSYSEGDYRSMLVKELERKEELMTRMKGVYDVDGQIKSRQGMHSPRSLVFQDGAGRKNLGWVAVSNTDAHINSLSKVEFSGGSSLSIGDAFNSEFALLNRINGRPATVSQVVNSAGSSQMKFFGYDAGKFSEEVRFKEWWRRFKDQWSTIGKDMPPGVSRDLHEILRHRKVQNFLAYRLKIQWDLLRSLVGDIDLNPILLTSGGASATMFLRISRIILP